MSWFKIDDQVSFHRKTVEAGNEAFGAWVRMGAHASAHRTNGHLTRAVALTMAGARVLARLVSVGFLDEADGGFQIHDYADWNPTEAQVEERRAARREAGKRGGIRSGEARRGSKQRSKTEATTKQTRSKREATVTQDDEANAKQTRTPSPSPSHSDLPSEDLSPLLQASDAVVSEAKRAAAGGDHADVIRHYMAEFRRIRGVDPVIDGRTGASAKSLLGKMSAPEVLGVITAAFEDPWWSKNAGELHQLAKDPNKFRGARKSHPGATTGHRQVQPADPDAPWMLTPAEEKAS